MLKGRSLLSTTDLTKQELLDIVRLGQQISKSPGDFSHLADGKILGTLFYEPSTRTRFSFEAAMLRLGGGVIGFSEPKGSSVSKGESLSDTIKTVSQYADIIVIRHPLEGAAVLADRAAEIPVVNAGDGGHQHPTQMLTDMLTTIECKGRLENLRVGICGDLKHGRTVHSLVKTMSQFAGNSFAFVSPQELRLPSYIKDNDLQKQNVPYVEVEHLEDVMAELDVLYMTRIQRERFSFEADYIRLKDSYILDGKKLKTAKTDLAIMHPLPRVNEIAVEVDSDPRAVYFAQAKYGMYVRMALITKLLGLGDKVC